MAAGNLKAEKMERQRRSRHFRRYAGIRTFFRSGLGINFLHFQLDTSQGGHDSKKAMSRTASRRLLAKSPQSLNPELTPTFRLPLRCLRPFSNTTRRKAEEDDTRLPPSEPRPAAPSSQTYSFPSMSRVQPAKPPPSSPSLNPKAASAGKELSHLSQLFARFSDTNQQSRNAQDSRRRSTIMDNLPSLSSDGSFPEGNLLPGEGDLVERAHQLHIYATRHNCHITVVRPPGYRNPLNGNISKNRTVLMSVACGNLAFRHSARKHYDSAFQLASYVMGILKTRGHIKDIEQLEVFLRGFGAGREAVTRALLGLEGAALRGKIVKVSDATRLKFGGTRSKKPRRLG
jgi:small subunit ribosomal protein S11